MKPMKRSQPMKPMKRSQPMEPKEEHRLQTKQSPIFTKTYDLLKWLAPHLDKYPKSQRFRLAKRIEDAAFDFYGLLIQATKEGKPRRTLLRADAELGKLRHPDNRNNNVGFRCVSQSSNCSLHSSGVAIPGLNAGRSRMSGLPQGVVLRNHCPRRTGAGRVPGWGQPQANIEPLRPLW